MSKAASIGIAILAIALISSIVYNMQVSNQLNDLSLKVDKLSSLIQASNSTFLKLNEEIKTLKSRLKELRFTKRTVVTTTKEVGQITGIVPLNLSQLYESVKESVVSIRVITKFGPFISSGAGSGFIYSKDGYIITNFHVIMNAVDVEVVFYDGEAVKAELVGQDPYSDLAVLKINTMRELKPLKLGDSSKLKVGDPIVAIGNPFGLSGSLTFGVVSQLGRTLETLTEPSYKITNVIQINAAVNPGNSGGPLLNLKGEVVGITTAIASRTGQSAGIGFVIPSNTVKREIKDLILKGYYEHPYLGIAGVDMTSSLSKVLGVDVTKGVLIVQVIPDAPADKAGLKGGNKKVRIGNNVILAGGDIIIKVNGKEIRNGDDLSAYLEEYTKPGMVIDLTIIREGREVVVKVKLGVRPPPQLR
jgi:S1-C subfamily serine protease